MDKKKIWIIIVGVTISIAIIVVGIVFNNYYKSEQIKKDKASIIKEASDFSLAWFNYTKQTDSEYMEKIRPYMTTEFYEATKYINTERPQDYEGQRALVSKILLTELRDYESESATVLTSLETKETVQEKQNISITVALVKIKGSWLVSNFE